NTGSAQVIAMLSHPRDSFYDGAPVLLPRQADQFVGQKLLAGAQSVCPDALDERHEILQHCVLKRGTAPCVSSRFQSLEVAILELMRNEEMGPMAASNARPNYLKDCYA